MTSPRVQVLLWLRSGLTVSSRMLFNVACFRFDAGVAVCSGRSRLRCVDDVAAPSAIGDARCMVAPMPPLSCDGSSSVAMARGLEACRRRPGSYTVGWQGWLPRFYLPSYPVPVWHGR